MTYSVGGLIQAADYNGFVNSVNNNFWSTGTGDSGWGQTAVSSVSPGGVVTATNWASLVNTLATAGAQTDTTLTSRTAPVTGNVIAILSNLATDISSVNTRRGYAFGLQGTLDVFTGDISYTSNINPDPSNNYWDLTWIQNVTFPSANQARYFWNAGGLVELSMSKLSTGTDLDPDWNTFVGTVGTLVLSGRVNNANQVISGTTYTGFTRFGGSGTPSTNLSTTGWYTLSPDTPTLMFNLQSTVSPYADNYIRVYAQKNATSTVLTLTTQWFQSTRAFPSNNSITGGTATTNSGFGTAPTVLPRIFTPATTYLTNTWGTPTVDSSVVVAVPFTP